MPGVAQNITLFLVLIPVFVFLVWATFKTHRYTREEAETTTLWSWLKEEIIEYLWVGLACVAVIAGIGLIYFGGEILGVEWD